MKKYLLFLFISIFYFAVSVEVNAQHSEFSTDGNIRFAYLGSTNDSHGFGGDNTSLRFRFGGKYSINKQHLFRARLAGTISQEFETINFTVKSDGGRLNYGTFTFDEFYYQFNSDKTKIKAGRFQKSVPVLTNAKRSNFRFQSNVNFIHWSDGIYVKHMLNEAWFGEVIAEYQPKDHITYSYRTPLNFANNDHNVTTYLGLENQTRDNNNIIQKGFGLFIAPDAYFYENEFKSYIAVMSRLAYDLHRPDLLNGGSFRIGAEIGQNLSSDFSEGTNMAISFGVNNVAQKHEFMAELAKTDSQWLTATVFAPDADELELRYRYFITKQLNVDFRYRIRAPRAEGVPYQYSSFIRATYSF